jgi:hypothetical protein
VHSESSQKLFKIEIGQQLVTRALLPFFNTVTAAASFQEGKTPWIAMMMMISTVQSLSIRHNETSVLLCLKCSRVQTDNGQKPYKVSETTCRFPQLTQIIMSLYFIIYFLLL